MQVYIYGSCVSRDAFELDSAPALAGYKARSTVGSAFGPPIDRTVLSDFDVDKNPSSFQRRMVISDFDKTFASELVATDFDILLVDFIDERFNMIPLGKGVVTCSAEAIKCGLQRRAADEITFGSPEHFRLFRLGWKRLIATIPAGKIVINRVYWAEKDIQGESVENADTVARSNAFLDELYAFVGQSSEVRFLNYERDSFIADSEHKWGRSPFHYVSALYEHTIKALSELQDSYTNDSGDQFHGSSAVGASPEFLLAGRHITSRCMLSFKSGSVIAAGGPQASDRVVRSSGAWEISDGILTSTFTGEMGDYVTSVQLPNSQERQNGFGARLFLEGWESIKYVAIGSMVDGYFRHIKIARPMQGSWINVATSYNDLLYRIQNNEWQGERLDLLAEVRVFIKGEPAAPHGVLKLRWCGVWQETQRLKKTELRPIKDEQVLSKLRDHLWSSSLNIEENIQLFLESGAFPVPGKARLRWPLDEAHPPGIEEVGTYRYVWHSLAFAANLITYAERYGDSRAAYAGKDFVAEWIQNNLYTESRDKRYAWYDHGTAERLISMLLVYDAGTRLGFDERFMMRLSGAVEEHSVLMESEAFYAANQRTRFHNHAWFQDLSLVAAGMAIDYGVSSDRWIRTGLGRMRQQVERLVIRDGDFSVFAENSTGYHDAATSIVGLIGEFATNAGYGFDLARVGIDMKSWSEYFRYPSGRRPSNGDTFRLGNDLEIGGLSADNTSRSFKVLPYAGYGVIKGIHGQTPFMLCFFATSISDTHKHADDLSFSLEYDGVEWFIDPSFYSHDYEEAIPKYLRGPWAHNSIVVEDAGYSLEPGLSHLGGEEKEGIESPFLLFGEHLRYKDLSVKRAITGSLDELRFNFRDQVLGSAVSMGSQRAYTVLHLGEGVQVESRSGSVVLRSLLSERELVLDFGTEYEVFEGSSDWTSSTSLAATEYGKVSPTITIHVPHQAGLELNWSLSER